MTNIDSILDTIESMNRLLNAVEIMGKPYNLFPKVGITYCRDSIDNLRRQVDYYIVEHSDEANKLTSMDEFITIAKSVVEEYARAKLFNGFESEVKTNVIVTSFSKCGKNMSASLKIKNVDTVFFKVKYDYDTDQLSLKDYYENGFATSFKVTDFKHKARVRKVVD